MKTIFWALFGLFLLFTLVQYNDPDPFLWVLLYGSVATQFAMAALGRLYRPATWLCLGAALVWAAFLGPDFYNWLQMGMPSIVDTMKAETPWVELAREFFGLLLAAGACGWLLWKAK